MDRIQNPIDRIVRLIGSAKERKKKGQDGAFEQALEQENDGEEQQHAEAEGDRQSRLLKRPSSKDSTPAKKTRSPDGKGLKVNLLA